MVFLSDFEPELDGRKVLVRLDLNVPNRDGRITDDSRIRAAVEADTIQVLRRHGARVALLTHIGHFKLGAAVTSTRILVEALSAQLGHEVVWCSDFRGQLVSEAMDQLSPEQVLLLENSRSLAEDEGNDPKLAQAIAEPFDYVVFDAFSAAHHEQASTTGIMRLRPNCLGMLMEHNLTLLEPSAGPQERAVACIGGKRMKNKVRAVAGFLQNGWRIFLGGVPLNVYLKVTGHPVGSSLCTDEGQSFDGVMAGLIEKWHNRFILPSHLIISPVDDPSVKSRMPVTDPVPEGQIIVDVVMGSQAHTALEEAERIILAGPLGKDENQLGMKSALQHMWDTAHSLVIGRDTAAVATDFPRRLTSSGSAIDYLAKDTLPVLEI